MKFNFKEYNKLVDFRQYDALTPKQAIKAKCLECCCFSRSEANSCTIYDCPLQQFINKKRNYTITPEERERRKNNFKNKN